MSWMLADGARADLGMPGSADACPPHPARHGDGASRRAHAALLLLLRVCELSAAAQPATARVPARAAAAITETRLRAAPERRAEPLLRLPEGATVIIHGKPEDGWYRATRGRLEGYVRSGDVATDPVPAAGAARRRKAADTGDAADDTGVVELAQDVRGRARSRRKAQKQLSREAGDAVAAADLNLRAGPSRDDPVRGVIRRRAKVRLTGEHRNGYVEVTWDGMTGWALGKHLAAPPPASRRDRDPGSWSRRELTAIIHEAADRYGQPREDMLRVARCESDMVPTAVNRRGGSYGLFQFKPSTWRSTPFAEYDIFDPRANANAAAWMWAQGRRREWVCQ
jgi:uncharacterized protein YgiM (DUF1202 family)